ncbi:MAG: hypothetical protein H0Z40_09165 [Desulfotomaculum sp.]|nr:hypothetical protein [Desulfotomaculum sp.]
MPHFLHCWTPVCGGIIHIRQGVVWTRDGLKHYEPKTEKSRRSIPLPQVLVDELMLHKERMQAEGNYREDGPVLR